MDHVGPRLMHDSSQSQPDSDLTLLHMSDLEVGTIISAAVSDMFADPFLKMSPETSSFQDLCQKILSSTVVKHALIEKLKPELKTMQPVLKKGHFEEMWSKFNLMMNNEHFVSGLIEILSNVLSVTERVLQLFTASFCDAVVKSMIAMEKENVKKAKKQESTKLTVSDKAVLFYIAGHLAHSMMKKNKCDKQKTVINSCVSQSECDVAPEIRAWLEKKDRGGLTKPSSDFYELVVCFETVLRREVDLDSLEAKSLATDKLKEIILSDSTVAHQWVNTIGSAGHQALLETFLAWFLMIRGYAVVKLEKKQRQKMQKDCVKSKSSFSLRKKLDAKSNLRRL